MFYPKFEIKMLKLTRHVVNKRENMPENGETSVDVHNLAFMIPKSHSNGNSFAALIITNEIR